MLNNRTWDNLLIPNRITATDLYRINDMFEQVKASEARIYSLFLTLSLKQSLDDHHVNLSYSQMPELNAYEKVTLQIKLESAYLLASYESLKETIKDFDGQPSGNNFISDLSEMEKSVGKLLEIVSLLDRGRE